MTGDGLVRPLNAPLAGPSAPGVQPGTSGGVDYARIVVVFGPAGSVTGVFVYAAGTTPGPGNPPVISLSENSSDPYGNTTVVPGIIQYGAGISYAGLISIGGTSILQFRTEATQSTVSPEAYGYAEETGTATEYQVFTAVSGAETPGGNSYLTLFSENANGTGGAHGQLGVTGAAVLEWDAAAVTADQPVVFVGQGAPARTAGSAVGFSNASGELQVVDGADGETYSTERLSLVVTAGVGLLTTGATQILASNVGVRSYRLSGMLLLTSNAVVSVSFEFAGTAVYTGEVAASIVRAAVLLGTNVIPPNVLTGVGGAMLGGGDVYICYLDGVVTVTGAGSMTLSGAVSANGAGVTVDPFSYLDVMPI